ncbi:MAG: dehypoxanthine futalosine cyclase [Desulfotignum sp.]|nr:dehypoxanthine futalosine cyclase [Desulfotignum sp.]MCF8125900.1 dehypoxanthine futalosine cyclase [Desulfotignum sp.]
MSQLSEITEKIENGQRIDTDQARVLLEEADLLTLGALANAKRYVHHTESIVTYVVDRNINYTNICVSGCSFCAFFKSPGQAAGYVITHKKLFEKIRETMNLGGTQILLQGGMHPDLGLDFYEEMLGNIKENFDIHIHGFSPPEIHFMAQKFKLSVAQTIRRLQQAGLDSIPGGGAEILCDEIRTRVSPNKCSAGEWLEVMRQAHMAGMRSSATMMFGHLEKDIHVIKHLERIRQLQDETGGFTAFIPWTFQPANTRIQVEKKTGVEYLKVLALSRIYLDNVENIQASWVTQGDKIAQTALFFGANDMGSTMIEENVVAAAGVDFMLPVKELRRLITTAGFAPCQRDCFYHLL